MSKKQFFIILLVGTLFAFIGGILSDGLQNSTEATEKPGKREPGKEIMNYLIKQGLFIGIVENGRFCMVAPKSKLGGAVRLTGIQMQESSPPDSRELDLTPYEGKAIMIEGHDGGKWIYRAVIVDKGGPLLTVMIKHTFAK